MHRFLFYATLTETAGAIFGLNCEGVYDMVCAQKVKYMALFEHQEKRAILHAVIGLIELFIGGGCVILLVWEFG